VTSPFGAGMGSSASGRFVLGSDDQRLPSRRRRAFHLASDDVSENFVRAAQASHALTVPCAGGQAGGESH
jgi:hypothetical protein